MVIESVLFEKISLRRQKSQQVLFLLFKLSIFHNEVLFHRNSDVFTRVRSPGKTLKTGINEIWRNLVILQMTRNLVSQLSSTTLNFICCNKRTGDLLGIVSRIASFEFHKLYHYHSNWNEKYWLMIDWYFSAC